MLVLSRKVDGEIRIGDDIIIKVIDVRGRSVRLGIEAPAEVRILRSELADASRTGEPETRAEPVSRLPSCVRGHSTLRALASACRLQRAS